MGTSRSSNAPKREDNNNNRKNKDNNNNRKNKDNNNNNRKNKDNKVKASKIDTIKRGKRYGRHPQHQRRRKKNFSFSRTNTNLFFLLEPLNAKISTHLLAQAV